MRLRTVDGRHYFALKQPGENAQACLEYETEVADREAMHGGIVHMGYRPDRPRYQDPPHGHFGALLAVCR